MAHPDVLVLGGGIVGLACARELAGAGLAVEVLERLPAGAEASVAAAGMLAPLAEVPEPGPMFEACRASRDLWAAWVGELEEETGVPLDYDASGALVVAAGEAEEAKLDELARAAEALGEMAEEVDLPAFRHRVPDLSPAVRRALLLPGEHRIDNIQACAVLAAAARRRGVLFSYGHEVERVEATGDDGEGGVRVEGRSWQREAGLLVLAAGAWSGRVPGLPALPVRPVRGQMALLGGVEWAWKGSVRGRDGYVVRRGETGLLVGATSEEAGFLAHTTAGGIAGLLAFVQDLFPGLAGALLEATWAGLRPASPDGLPILGRLPGTPPVIVATGHYRNGILLAPWTGRLVARLATAPERVPGEFPQAAAFDPGRFPGREAAPALFDPGGESV